MSLNGALQIGRSGLLAGQAAIQVAGNNMANAATEGYTRRTVHLAPARDEVIGRNQFVGQGVQLQRIRREVDTALQARFRDATSHEGGALISQRFLAAIETIQNELGDNDLSSLLSELFNSFSELANNPLDTAVRAVVMQQGLSVSSHIAGLRADYNVVREEIDRSLASSTEKVNDILGRIELLNGQIAQTEQGVGEAAGLRDQRDILIDELAGFMEISVVELPSGAADVFVGSLPIILNGQSRGIELRTETIGGQLDVTVRVAADGSLLNVTSGSIGALLEQRTQTVQGAIDDLDALAEQLIFQVNRVHSQGQGAAGHGSITGTYSVEDTTAALNSAAADLPFDIANGSFFIHVTHQASGLRTTHRIDIDGSAMSLDDLVNEINTVVGVPNVTAGVSVDRQLTLAADAGYEISFSDDSSGALAVLGVNTFFAGEDAASIDVNQALQDNVNLLAAGAGHVAGSNDTALTLAGLQHVSFDLGGVSLRAFWQNSISRLGVKAGAANAAVESAVIVRENLAAQKQAVSGVSLDEESINLLTAQRQFQAAARFITVIDEAMQTLLSIA
jgi:flagellar hook-associated protein 1 FlgK